MQTILSKHCHYKAVLDIGVDNGIDIHIWRIKNGTWIPEYITTCYAPLHVVRDAIQLAMDKKELVWEQLIPRAIRKAS